MPRRFYSFGLSGVLVALAACSASNAGNVFQGEGGDDSSGDSSGGVGGDSTGTFSTSGGDGGFDLTTVGSGGGSPSGCSNPQDVDNDADGFTEQQGDCNDCDPNVNPGAIEVVVSQAGGGGAPPAADEDCDGTIDNPLPTCDGNLALEDFDPYSGAQAIDLCQRVNANDPNDRRWGVLDAQYVRASGAAGAAPAQVGIFDSFGPNVNVQGGARLLAQSSGNARRPGDAGACNSNSCSALGFGSAAGSAPPGFPQDVPSCDGSSDINDDVALQVRVRAPRNATGFSFLFDFYSFEYPEWVCTSFNDQFIALVDPPPAGSINGNVSFDSQNNPVSVNIAFFGVCSGCALGTEQLNGTGFDGAWGDNAGATSWLKTQAPITGGQEMTIRFAIWDTGDTAWDSTVLIDGFQWIANGGTVSVGTEPIPDPK